ncbi:MAG: thiolase family protein [Sphingobium sp.]
MTLQARRSHGYDGVAVCAPVTVPYARYSNESAHWWIARAIRMALDESGLEPGRVDGLCVSSFTLGVDSAVGLTQHLGLTLNWLDHIPMGGASSVVALRRAARAVQAGDAEIIVCVAGDTNQVHSFRRTAEYFSRFSQDAAYPYGAGGPNACFALLTDHYMRHFGVQREDFAHVCVAQRANAGRNPLALFRKPMTVDEYMRSRMISDPICLLDCVMPCAGAEAFIVTTPEIARTMGKAFARLLATQEHHNAFPEDPIQYRAGWARDPRRFWDTAGVTPDQVDLVQTYDDYPVISLMQVEDLGFCDKGEAGAFLRERNLTVDGEFPHNTSGGQLSGGQAGAGGGYLGTVEALRQLNGTADGRQVKDARIAVVSGFGMINYDRGVCSGAVVLAGEGA